MAKGRPPALTDLQEGEVRAWFVGGMHLDDAVAEAERRGWKVGRTKLGELQRAVQRAAERPDAPVVTPAAGVTPAGALRRALAVAVGIAEADLPVSVRLDACGAVARLVAVKAPEDPDADQPGASDEAPHAPFTVGAAH